MKYVISVTPMSGTLNEQALQTLLREAGNEIEIIERRFSREELESLKQPDDISTALAVPPPPEGSWTFHFVCRIGVDQLLEVRHIIVIPTDKIHFLDRRIVATFHGQEETGRHLRQLSNYVPHGALMYTRVRVKYDIGIGTLDAGWNEAKLAMYALSDGHGIPVDR